MRRGDLESFRRPQLVKSLANAGLVRTIFLLEGEWLSFEADVQIARGVTADGTTARTYITGLDVPRYTTPALASIGAEPYPVATRPLGVPNPGAAPVLEVQPPAVVQGDVTLTNPGAEVGTTGWTATSGTLVSHDSDDVPGLAAYAGTHFFGATGVTEATQDVDTAAEGIVEGQSFELVWRQAHGAGGGEAAMGVRFLDGADALLGEVLADLDAPGPALTWQERRVSGAVPVGCETIRIVMQFDGTGDAYVDAVLGNRLQYGTSYDGSSTAGWTIRDGGDVTIDNTQGWPAPSIRLNPDGNADLYMYRDIGSDQSPAMVIELDVATGRTSTIQPYASSTGAGYGLQLATGSGVNVVYVRDWLSTADGQVADYPGAAVAANKPLRVRMSFTRKSTVMARATIRVTDKLLGAVIVDDEVIEDWRIDGSNLSLKAFSTDSRFDNIDLLIDPPAAETADETVFTTYVVTFVNVEGDESGPSPASNIVQRSINSAVEVETPTVPPAGIDYGIDRKRLYRAATGATGTAYLFVDEIPLAQALYVDQKSDAELGEPLATDLYALPPADLRGIIALPNGVLCGFFRNQLCFTPINRPHAWPVPWRLTTDSDIVAIEAVDTTVIIGTKTYVYAASGTDPGTYQMSKPGVARACTSGRSMAYLPGVGVVFAGPDGLMVARGPTDVDMLTQNVLTAEQWRALDVSSIETAIHDKAIVLCWKNGSSEGMLRLDLAEQGEGLISVSLHAGAMHVDPETGRLYLVIDSYAEPEHALLTDLSEPLAGANGRTVFEWDAGEAPMVYAWRGKLHLLPYPNAFGWAQLKLREDGGAVVQRLIGDGGLIDEALVTSEREYRLQTDGVEPYVRAELELIGTAVVATAEVTDSVSEVQ